MTDKAHRTAELDRLLRRALDVSAGAPGGPCPAPDLLAAYVEGGLDDRERSAFEAHASGCGRCLESLAVLAELEPLDSVQAEPAAARPWWRTFWPWVAPLTAVATAAVLYLAVRPASSPISPAALPDVQMADKAVGQDVGRTTEFAAEPGEVPSQSAGSVDVRSEEAVAEGAARSTGEPKSEDFAGQPSAATAAVQSRPPAALARKAESQSPAGVAQAPASSPPPTAVAAPGHLSDALASPDTRADASPSNRADPRAQRRDVRERAEGEAATPTPIVAEAVGAADSMAKATVSPTAAAASADAGGGGGPRQIVASSPNGESLWRLRPAGVIERSTDQGRTWRRQVSGTTQELLAAAATDASTCWVVGRGATILWTGDGERWRAVPPPVSTDFHRVRAASVLSATVTATDGRAFQTDDGGRTWRLVGQ